MNDKMQNPSVLLSGAGQASIVDRPIPELTDPNDVIIKIAYVGVCGSDVHFWRHGGIRTFIPPSPPLVVGHEASGTVHSTHPSASHSLRPGDNIAIEPGIPCRTCSPCKSGRYNLCSRMRFAADPGAGPEGTDGTLCRFYKTAADFCYRLPDKIGLREGVLIEPLAVAVHAVRLAKVNEPGTKVVVFGAGTVGLFCAAVAKEFGAKRVVSVDLLKEKLQVAKRMIGENEGGTWIPDAQNTPPEESADRLKKECGLVDESESDEEGGAHVVLDATGAESCVQTGIFALRPGGIYVQVGMGKRNINFPIAEVCEREITVKGCFRYGPGDFEIALDLVRRHKIALDGLVTGEYAFDKPWDAWESTGRGDGIKNVIVGPKE